jgi:hypothetical protein
VSAIITSYFILVSGSLLLARVLTASNSGSVLFEETTTIPTNKDLWTVLRNTRMVANAYSGDKDDPTQSQVISLKNLKKPSLFASSFLSWDEDVKLLANGITHKVLTPLAVDFVDTNQLIVHLGTDDAKNPKHRFFIEFLEGPYEEVVNKVPEFKRFLAGLRK